MQSDAYIDLYSNEFESMLKYIAGTCQLAIPSFNASASVFNVTAKDDVADVCVSSNYYTTKQGDTCDSIALSHKVSAATLYHTNDNIINCTSIASGAKLCLPLPCNELYSVQPDDDCSSIAADAGILTRQFLSYNTVLTWNCTNLHSTNPYWGTTVCVTTPGGTYSGQPLNNTQPEGSQPVSPPTGAIVAKGSTTDCGQWHLNDGSLLCVQICLQYQITINLLTAANPSLGKATCDQDLVKGDAYCVDPILGWDSGQQASTTASAAASSTSSSITKSTLSTTSKTSSATSKPSSSTKTTSSASKSTSSSIKASSTTSKSTSSSIKPATISKAVPSPTEPGTIATCKTFHLVVSGDSCAAICQQYKITEDNFYKWNTQVGGTACSGLWLSYYVYVGV